MGTPFYNSTGTQTSADEAAQKPTETFVKVGPNQIPIPIIDTKTGLGWQQIVGKAKQFSGQMDTIQKDQTNIIDQHQKLQAQQVIAINKGKDPSQLTPEDQAALAQAKQILGQ